MWSVLNRARLLTPAKLQWLSNADVKMVIAQALREDPVYDKDATIEEALQSWLKDERWMEKLPVRSAGDRSGQRVWICLQTVTGSDQIDPGA